jgi:hypothetical protein
LHIALNENDTDAASNLIETGDLLLLNQQSTNGVTPLMLLAMGYCSEELIWRLLERRGSVSIAAFSDTRRTAADYAKEGKRSPNVADTLRQLENDEMQRSAKHRCPVCGDVVKRRPLLKFFQERADRGQEDNALLRRFFSNKVHRALEQPRYHQVNGIRTIRKELSESIAVLEALECDLPCFSSSWHIVDLCSGKSITSLLASLRHPGVTVSAVDRLDLRFVPHFASEEQGSIQYTQLDVMDESFIENLDRLVAESARPTALLGMHLCGNLSVRAIKAFQDIQAVHAVVLSPCCLPAKSDGATPPHLYHSKDADDQYKSWAHHLEDTLQNATPDAAVSFKVVHEILSPKNIVICAIKPSALAQNQD